MDPQARDHWGLGVDSADIIGMTDAIMRGMASSPRLTDRAGPALILLDSAHMKVDGNFRVNAKLVCDRLRTQLKQRAGDRFHFVALSNATRPDDAGPPGAGGDADATDSTRQASRPTADFQLAGRFTDVTKASRSHGFASYHHVVFEIIDLESGELVWSGSYEFKKVGIEDSAYR